VDFVILKKNNVDLQEGMIQSVAMQSAALLHKCLRFFGNTTNM